MPGPAVHEPDRLPGRPSNSYPRPIVVHAEERRQALARHQALKIGR